MRRVLAFSMVLLAGCVSQAQHDEVTAQLDECATDLQARSKLVDESKSAVRKLERELKAAQARVVAMEDELKEVRLAELYTSLGAQPGAELQATFVTTAGDITCELWPQVAPLTVSNFVGLARGTKAWKDPKSGEERTDPLYSGTVFHRTIKGFMIQGGDPLGTGRGGPGYRFGDEVDEDVRFDQDGLLAMANAGPNTNGSQFFITDEGAMPRHLDGKHTIFGKCENMDVVHDIATRPVVRDQPVEPVVVRRVDVAVR